MSDEKIVPAKSHITCGGVGNTVEPKSEASELPMALARILPISCTVASVCSLNSVEVPCGEHM